MRDKLSHSDWYNKSVGSVRFIAVKGHAVVGEIALSTSEYKTAERLKKDFWFYAVFNCASKAEIHIVQDPVSLGWIPIMKIVHYHVWASKILGASPAY